MKTYRYLSLLLLLAVSYLVYSCGGGSGLPSSTGEGTTTTTGASEPAGITLTATPSSITVQGTSSVTATVLDSSGVNVTDGIAVTFTLSSSTLGSISPIATTTSSGVATATFTASGTAGTVTITGTAGSVSDNRDVTVTAPATGSIEFTSATPTVIGIKGSGQTETSLIKFTIRDINGNAVADGILVDFVMSGPGGGRAPANGGEYIGYDVDTPTEASVSTVNGEASVYLNSGYVAGPVIIVATVNGTSMSSASTPLSIGGGVPNDPHFTIAAEKYNLEGLSWVNIQTNISVFMADRFGNFNVLEGTSVSFYAESGAIDRNDVTDSTGSTSVVFRTQRSYPKDVAPEAWETTLQNYVNTNYSVLPTGHPRDGWATILVTTKGEEAFDDVDANGIYNSGIDQFSLADQDTPQEAFIDINDNSSRDDETSADPFEICIDENENSTCDGTNLVWDSDKTIFKDLRLLITSSPAYILYTPTTFNIDNTEYQTFTVLVSDINLNYLIEGTTVSIATDKGELTGATSYTFPDVAPTTGAYPLELSFTLTDNEDEAIVNPEPAMITITVTWKGGKYIRYISGTID